MHRSCFLVAMLALAGCTPEIGDECTTALDCSQLGDRLCDTTQPDGYCTIFNCEPGTCPEEAACVGFNRSLDPACGNVDNSRHGRFARSFCMLMCDDDDDCRDGYECKRPIDKWPGSSPEAQDGQAIVIDTKTEEDNPQDTKVCLVKGVPATPQPEPPGACYPNEGVGGLTPYQPGQGGAGGTGGIGGSGGTGGSGGAGGSGGSGGVAGGGGN